MAIEFNNEVMETLMTEQIMQNTKAFAQGTGGAIVPMTEYHKGDFEEEIFFTSVGGVKRRDPNVNNAAVADALNTANQRGVKLYFYKDVEYKLTDINRYGKDPDALAVKIGQDLGAAVTAEMLNNGLISAVAAIGSGTCVFDGTAGKPDVKTLNQMLRLFGDQSQSLKAIVANSNFYFNLNDAGIGSGLDTVASGVLYDATPATMGRKTYVTDSLALSYTDATLGQIDQALMLQQGAVVVKESEERLVTSEIVTGGENAIYRVHLEGAMTVSVKGYAYKDTAGANPDAATLGASANWQQVVTDIKAGAGVLGKALA